MSTQLVVAFFRGRKYARSWPLAWWQRSEFSHCEIVLRQVGDVYEMASSTWRDGGVRIKVEPINVDDWEAFAVPADHDAAVFWLAQHVGDRYGLLGLLGFLIRRIKGPREQWWCSKACAAMLGFEDAWRYDVATLRDVCRRIGYRVEL